MNAQANIGAGSGLAKPVDPEIVRLISEHPFFKGLGDVYVRMLAESAMLTSFRQGELIFREGDMANRFYLIREGKVLLEAPQRDVEPLAIQTIGAGDVLGWSWLYPPYYWHFDARAIEPTKAVFFYGTRLRDYCEADHSFGYELMKRTAEVVISRLQAERKRLLEWERRRK